MSRRERNSANAGFTLLEVIVAFLVLSMVLGSAMLSISYSTRLYRKSDEIASARQLAERLIAEKFGDGRGQPEKEVSNLAGGLHWQIARTSIEEAFTPSGNRLMQFELTVLDRHGRLIDHYRSLYVER